MKRQLLTLGAATAFAVGLASSHAGESVFQEGVNGYTGTLDTEIVGGQPDAEGSNTTTLNPDGSDRGGVVQVLIRFENIFGTEPNQIPPGQSVFFATLTLNISGPGSDQDLHRVLVPWEETVTWNDISDPFDPQGFVADDVLAAIEPDVTFQAPAVVTEIELPPSTIQAWLDGTTPNYGWVMIPTGSDGVDFSSSESAVPNQRPILKVVWGTPGLPFLQASTPSADGISFRVKDGDGAGATQVDPASIILTVDGVAVTPEVSKEGEFTAVKYTAPALLASGSVHSYKFSFGDTASPSNVQTEEKSFTVPSFATIPAFLKVADSAVNKSNSGFNVGIHQMEEGRPSGNTLPGPVQQVRGELIDSFTGQPVENLLDSFWPGEESKWVPNPSFTDTRIYHEDGVINYNQDARDDPTATQGNFGPDNPIPGIPGITGSTDNIAVEATTFLELDAGLHRMGVNSDDGFVVSSSANPRDALAVQLGLFNGGRGAADTFFDFAVEEAGIYPFTLHWWEGGGGANVEWFVIDLDSGEMTLINDTANPNAVKAYRTGPPAPPYASSAVPVPGAKGVPSDISIEIVLEDAAQQVQTSSVKLTVNGQSVTPQVSKAGGTTTITYDPQEDFEPASTVTVSLEYGDNASPPNVVTQGYSFETLGSAVFTFQEGVNGYIGTIDTQVRAQTPDQDDSEIEELNPDGEDGGGENHVLIRFENIFGTGAGQIPPGSAIAEATLTLEITNEGSDQVVHRMLVPWNESVTWNEISSDPLDPTGVSADDVTAASAADAVFAAPQGTAVVNLSVATLQAWSDGTAENYGWVLLPSGTNGADFPSSENPDPAVRPLLTVTLEEPLYSVRVASGTDDSEEHLTESNAIDITSSDLELGAEGGGGDIQEIGIRFQNVAIAQGATINGATIQFTVDEADDEPTSLLIYGELASDAATFTTTAGDISSRQKTTAVVEWNDIPVWDDASIGTAGPDQRTPNLASIVQEIVNQPGWSAGNAMAFIISPNPGGERTAESYNGDDTAAALLEVDFSKGGEQPPPGGGGDATISIARSAGGATITYSGTLQSADSVAGPYADVAGASSPAEIPFSGTAKFFRTRQ